MIACVLDTKNVGLKMEQTGNTNKPWEIICFRNGDNVRDPVSRRSISGFVLYVLCIPVSWQSKAQKSVTLLRLEAELVALSEAV